MLQWLNPAKNWHIRPRLVMQWIRLKTACTQALVIYSLFTNSMHSSVTKISHSLKNNIQSNKRKMINTVLPSLKQVGELGSQNISWCCSASLDGELKSHCLHLDSNCGVLLLVQFSVLKNKKMSAEKRTQIAGQSNMFKLLTLHPSEYTPLCLAPTPIQSALRGRSHPVYSPSYSG